MTGDNARKLIEDHEEQRQQLAKLRLDAMMLADDASAGQGKTRADVLAEIDRLDADLAEELAELQADGAWQPGDPVH